ncbi:MAG: TolC family protein, partial [Spirochaetia bacterium]|nr:TolC family protein [Spirochaetia bacterium]
MKRRAFLLISVGLLCIPSVVRAARMGLLEAERVALENSPDLRLLRLETAALSEAQSARIRDFFPQVSVSYRQNRVVALRDYDNGQYSTQIQISQPVYDGGRSSLAYELAGYDVRLARERARKLRGSLRLQVRKAFFKVQQTSVQVSVSEASLESASALLQKSRVERTRGLATELDLREIDNEQKRRYAQLKKDQAA